MLPILFGTDRRPSVDTEENTTCIEDDLESGSISSLVSSPGPNSIEKRTYERELILKYDSKELVRGDAWFLIETKWMDDWLAYVLADDDPESPPKRPGPLTNYSLYDTKEFRIKKGLQVQKDYRGVNPQIYCLYTEMYGIGNIKPIVRWTLDIYALPVLIDDVKEMMRGPALKARVEVAEMNERFDPIQIVEHEQESNWYRCLCRCEQLIPCLGRLLIGPTYVKDQVQTQWKKRQTRRTSKRRRDGSRKGIQKYSHRRKSRKSNRKTMDSSDEESESSENESESEDDREHHGLLQ